MDNTKKIIRDVVKSSNFYLFYIFWERRMTTHSNVVGDWNLQDGKMTDNQKTGAGNCKTGK